jgi:hypothetical protein
MGAVGGWKSSLKDWYYERHRGKDDILITHEAIQLEALSSNNKKGRKSMFLTADKRFIASSMEVSQHLDFRISNVIVMPVQFSYYLDIDEEEDVDWKAYSRILWSKGYKDMYESCDEFYINRVLREYEPKLVASIPEILSSITKEIDRRPRFGAEDLEDENISIRQYIYLEQFDEEFYSIMDREKRKHGLL